MLQAELPQLKKRMNPLLALHRARAMVASGDQSPPCLSRAAGCFLPLSLLPGDLGKSKQWEALRHHQQVPGSNGVSAAIRYLINLLNK